MVQLLQMPQVSQEAGLLKRHQTLFTTVHSEGGILPLDLLLRLSLTDASLPGIKPSDYHLYDGEKLNEAINQSWNRLLGLWANFKRARAKLPATDSGTTMTRERWLYPLFNELDYGRRLMLASPIEVKDESRIKRYPISHGYQYTPIHLVSYKIELDQLERKSSEGRRTSPASLVQEALNRSDACLWGFVTNGLRLRVLRDNVSLTRQAFVEFDLESMLDNEVYADFVLFWLLCHQSRVEAEKPKECWLENWSKLAQEQGTRALERLRDGVEHAISALGRGFLSYRRGVNNEALRGKLRTGELSTQDYYRQILRLVYRLLVLFVAEDRDVLFHPEASSMQKAWYAKYYSTAQLRLLADKRIGTLHSDLFHALRTVMKLLSGEQEDDEHDLGLTALNGFLFSKEALPDLEDCEIANHDLLDAIRALAVIQDGRMRRVVDYRNLGSEELGSVYESLLELHPVLNIDVATFKLEIASGNERKTTGSYYTPSSLISCLLDSALNPVLEEASQQPDPIQAILNLKVCDPACGSGHFLIAAGYRIARKLASIRSGLEEPSPEEQRKALREVVARCLYGVDINPMSVEICKLSLWMEAIEPGKPLNFLDAHIQEGNSLLGATPTLLNSGIPDSAFEPGEGDDKKVCSYFKKRNTLIRRGNRSLFDSEGNSWESLGNLVTGMIRLDDLSDTTVVDVRYKQAEYEQLIHSEDYLFNRLWADAWCAAFVWKKTNEFAYPITDETFRNMKQNPDNIPNWMHNEIERLTEHYKFFHWHLAFSDVFHASPQEGESKNATAGWSGGFDVVLGNPPYIFGEDLNRKTKLLFQSVFQLAKGQYDTYWLFIEQVSKLVNSRGRFALVVPDTLLARDENQETRRFLLNEGLEYLCYCGTVFKANVSTIIFAVAKESKSHHITSESLDEISEDRKFKFSKERFLSDPKQRFLINISDEEANIISRIEKECKPLKSFVRISRGEEIGKKEVLSEGPIPILVGSDISRYSLQPISRFVQKIKKDLTLYQSPKIVMLKTGYRCIASLDEVGHVTMQSVYNLHVLQSEIAYETILALLNSRFVYYYVYKTFTSYKGLFPQLNQSTVEAIPVPTNIFSNQKNLVSLVRHIIDLNENLTIANSEQEEKLLKSQIETLNAEIDHSIYSLFELTQEEITVYESNLKE